MKSRSVGIRRTSLAVAAIAVSGTILAGCSTPSETDDAGLTGDPVKVGLIADPVDAPTQIAAIKAAINALNKRGGLEGRPMELVYCDDKKDPNVTTTCGRKMVDEKVVAIVGGGAVNGNVLVPIFEDAGIASIGVQVGDPIQASAPDYFYFTAGEASTVAAAYSGQAGLKTSMFAVEMPETQALVQPTLDAAAAAGTPELTLVQVPMSQADYAPIIATGKPDEANAAQLVLAPSQEPILVQSALDAGWSPTWLLDAEPQKAVLEAVEGSDSSIVYASPLPALTPDSDDPEVRRYFEEELKTAEDAGVEHADQAIAYPSHIDAEGWLSVQVVAQLVEDGDAKDLTGPDVLDALKKVDGMDIGLVKSWLPNAVGPEGSRGGNFAFNLVEIHDGTYTSLTEEPVTAEDLISGKVTVPAPAGIN